MGKILKMAFPSKKSILDALRIIAVNKGNQLVFFFREQTDPFTIRLFRDFFWMVVQSETDKVKYSLQVINTLDKEIKGTQFFCRIRTAFPVIHIGDKITFSVMDGNNVLEKTLRL